MDEDKQKVVIEVDLGDEGTLTLPRDEGDEKKGASITELYHRPDHKEFASKIQAITDASKRINEMFAKYGSMLDEPFRISEQQREKIVRLYEKFKTLTDANYQALLDAGYSEEDLANLKVSDLADISFVAYAFQGKVGNGYVGHALVKQLKDRAQRVKREVRRTMQTTATLSGLSYHQVWSIHNGDRQITVDEAAQLAVAYGITTGELLGIVDEEEVKLLKLWRNMDAAKREHLLGLLES